MKFYLSLVLLVLMLFAQETVANNKIEVEPPTYEIEFCCDFAYCNVATIQKEDAKAKEVLIAKETKIWLQRPKNENGNYFADRQKNKDRLSFVNGLIVFDLWLMSSECNCPHRE